MLAIASTHKCAYILIILTRVMVSIKIRVKAYNTGAARISYVHASEHWINEKTVGLDKDQSMELMQATINLNAPSSLTSMPTVVRTNRINIVSHTCNFIMRIQSGTESNEFGMFNSSYRYSSHYNHVGQELVLVELFD